MSDTTLKKLEGLGYEVAQLAPFHYRLNGRVDVYWALGNRLKKYHILETNERGILGGDGSLGRSLNKVFGKVQGAVYCPYCHQEAAWVPNEEVYGRRYGKSYMCYWCRACDAYVGCHQNTRRPLGVMANKELRQARMKAHAIIDPFWRRMGVRRSRVYETLKDIFKREIHVGEADLKTCQEIIDAGPEIERILYKEVRSWAK